MGKLLSGIEGHFIGNIGTVVGSSWKGIPYVKAKAVKKKHNRKKKPVSANQSKFAVAHYWLQPLLDFVREGFRGYTDTVEGFNAAKSVAMKSAFVRQGDIEVIDPALVQVSYGDLPLPSHLSVSRLDKDTLQFEWDPVSEGGSPYDQAMLLAYDAESKLASFRVTAEFRKAGKDTLHAPALKASKYHVYIAFIADDRSRQSSSVYLGAF